MSRTRVKICGITCPQATETAIDAGADAIGLVFAESRRQIDVPAAHAILKAVPAWVTPVAVFRRASEADVNDVVSQTDIRTVQADHDSVWTAGMHDLTIIRVYRFGPGFDHNKFLAHNRVCLLEGPSSGTGTTIDWQAVAPLARQRRVILAGGLTPDNVGEAIRIVRPYAVDVSSGVESTPGQKDPIKVRDFLRAVRSADGL